MKAKKEILLIGGGGHCKSCIDVIEAEGKFKIAGILDVAEKVGQDILGYPIIGTDEQIPSLVQKSFSFLITVGQIKNVLIRVALFERLKQLNAKLSVIISSTGIVSEHSEVHEGTIVMHQTIINAGAIIGKNCIINTKALVEHDAKIGSHTHISTNAVVNGECIVGDRCFVGSNSVINHRVKITDDVIIGAGAVVTKNIKESGVYVGNPAKRIK